MTGFGAKMFTLIRNSVCPPPRIVCPTRAEFLAIFKRRFYRSERVPLLHTQLRNSGEKSEKPLEAVANCNPDDPQSWEDTSYRKFVVEDGPGAIGDRSVELEHPSCVEGLEKPAERRPGT